MKKIMAMILAAVLLLSLAACGAAGKNSLEAYVPSEDFEVAVAFVDRGAAKVATRKISDREVSAIELACVYFDGNGEQVGQSEQIQCDFTTEDSLSIWSFAAAQSSKYMEVVVSGVTYADGTQHACPGVSDWIQATVKSFSIEKHKQKMEKLATEEAVKAQQCDAVELNLEAPVNNEQNVGVKNLSGKKIATVTIYQLLYDPDGVPMDVKGVFIPNAKKISAEILDVGEEATYTVVVPEDTTTVKGIVQSVIFEDGSVWENNYVYEWAVCNYETAK